MSKNKIKLKSIAIFLLNLAHSIGNCFLMPSTKVWKKQSVNVLKLALLTSFVYLKKAACLKREVVVLL